MYINLSADKSLLQFLQNKWRDFIFPILSTIGVAEKSKSCRDYIFPLANRLLIAIFLP